MVGEANPPPPPGPKPKFSVYQNPTFSAALTANSLRPSPSFLLFISSFSFAVALSLLAIFSRKERLAKNLTQIHISLGTAILLTKVLQALLGLVFVATLAVLIRALLLHKARNALATGAQPLASSPSEKPEGKRNTLTQRQLGLLGLKLKPSETADAESLKKPPKSKAVSSQPASNVPIPIRKSAFSYTPTRLSRFVPNQQSTIAVTKMGIHPVSPPSASPVPPQYTASPSTPWSRKSSGSAKGIQTEEMLEQFLAEMAEMISESAATAATTPPAIRGFGVASPSSITSSVTPSGTTRSTPLRPVRMSPGSHQKYSTSPKKGEGDLPPPMSMEQAVEAFESLGIYPQIEQWRDRLRQWFSSVLLNPLLEKIERSHVQVMQAAGSLGMSIAVSKIGSDTPTTAPAVNVSPIDGAKEWQPTFTLDEDGLLHQLRASLLQARDGSMSHSPLTGLQQPQQNPLLPLIQACVDAISDHQRLNTLMKGELIKGLLPHSSVRADHAVQRVRELAEGTCLKNYDYLGNGDGLDKSGKKWTSELPTDAHLLVYLFSAFLEHPKWMLHVDPASYSGAQSSKNPLFLGVLPPKERFPEKYVAIISGVPSVLHPGACILALGKQSPPIFALYWDQKLQFSLKGRTALWDAHLLLCHRIKVGYGGIVRGVHLGSSALNILPVLASDTES